MSWRSWCSTLLDLHCLGLVEHGDLGATCAALAERNDKLLHTLRRHEEVRGEGVRPNLQEIRSVLCAADGAGSTSIQEDVAVLVSKGEALSNGRVLGVDDHEHADRAVDERQPRDVLGERDGAGTHSLRLQQIAQVTDRRCAEPQPLPLFRSHLLPLLDGIPARSGGREFVRRGEELNAVDT